MHQGASSPCQASAQRHDVHPDLTVILEARQNGEKERPSQGLEPIYLCADPSARRRSIPTETKEKHQRRELENFRPRSLNRATDHAHLPKVLHGYLELSQSHVGRPPPIVGLRVLIIQSAPGIRSPQPRPREYIHGFRKLTNKVSSMKSGVRHQGDGKIVHGGSTARISNNRDERHEGKGMRSKVRHEGFQPERDAPHRGKGNTLTDPPRGPRNERGCGKQGGRRKHVQRCTRGFQLQGQGRTFTNSPPGFPK